MAKGDANPIGVGYNPGGPVMGGMASFGSKPPMQMNPGGVGPANNMLPPAARINDQGQYQEMPNQPNMFGTTGGQYKPQPMPTRAEGPMIPGAGAGIGGPTQPSIGPGFNPMEGIMRMLNMRNQGTSTTTPMAPNNYALNPSANLFSGGGREREQA